MRLYRERTKELFSFQIHLLVSDKDIWLGIQISRALSLNGFMIIHVLHDYLIKFQGNSSVHLLWKFSVFEVFAKYIVINRISQGHVAAHNPFLASHVFHGEYPDRSLRLSRRINGFLDANVESSRKRSSDG